VFERTLYSTKTNKRSFVTVVDSRRAPRTLVNLCGKYIGDNDGICPQLTCIRKAGHEGLCDNVVGDDSPQASMPTSALFAPQTSAEILARYADQLKELMERSEKIGAKPYSVACLDCGAYTEDSRKVPFKHNSGCLYDEIRERN
jgi:hypothetical protein